MSLSLESSTGDQSLNLRCLGVWLGSFLLPGDLSSNNELTNVVLLGQVEEFADVVGSLRTKSLWYDRVSVGEAGNILLALLDNNQVQGLHVWSDDATSDRLPSSLSSSS